jgi:hypothetical protein
MDYQPYPATMQQHDFDLYPPHEQQFEFVPTSQPYLPTNYSVDPSFSAPYESVSMPAMSEPPRPQELQFHYDGIAQGVKPNVQYTPDASPHSALHSFEHPPLLSASSESGASVSSSNMPSPQLNPQYNDSWNPTSNGLGLPLLQSHPAFEYDGLTTEKIPGCVGESTKVSFRNVRFPVVTSSPITTHKPYPRSECVQSNVFNIPCGRQSATWSASKAAALPQRRCSTLSNEVFPTPLQWAVILLPQFLRLPASLLILSQLVGCLTFSPVGSCLARVVS